MRKAIFCVAVALALASSAFGQAPAKLSVSMVADAIDHSDGIVFSGNVVIIIDGTKITASKALYRPRRNELEVADGAALIKLSASPAQIHFGARYPRRTQ